MAPPATQGRLRPSVGYGAECCAQQCSKPSSAHLKAPCMQSPEPGKTSCPHRDSHCDPLRDVVDDYHCSDRQAKSGEASKPEPTAKPSGKLCMAMAIAISIPALSKPVFSPLFSTRECFSRPSIITTDRMPVMMPANVQVVPPG